MQRLPHPRLMATTHGPVPDRPFEPLVPFVVAEEEDGVIVDWHLDPAARTHLDTDVHDLYLQWRKRWTRTVRLETLFNVARLHTLVDETRPAGVGSAWFDAVSRLLATGEPEVIAQSDLEALQYDGGALRDMVQQSETTATAAIDTTPGSERVGLAAVWAVDRVEQVVAADDDMTVVVAPDGRLIVRGPALLQITAAEVTIEEVTIGEVNIGPDRVSIVSGSDETHLSPAQAQPLTWLVPHASSWRIRTVPAVLAWTPTFAELPDLCEESLALERSLTLWIDPTGCGEDGVSAVSTST